MKSAIALFPILFVAWKVSYSRTPPQRCAVDETYGHVATLVKFRNANEPVKICGGTIIDSNKILTAASCVKKIRHLGLNDFYVHVGNRKLEKETEYRINSATMDSSEILGLLTLTDDISEEDAWSIAISDDYASLKNPSAMAYSFVKNESTKFTGRGILCPEDTNDLFDCAEPSCDSDESLDVGSGIIAEETDVNGFKKIALAGVLLPYEKNPMNEKFWIYRWIEKVIDRDILSNVSSTARR